MCGRETGTEGYQELGDARSKSYGKNQLKEQNVMSRSGGNKFQVTVK